MARRSTVSSRAWALVASAILLVGGGVVPPVRAADPTPSPAPSVSIAPTPTPSLTPSTPAPSPSTIPTATPSPAPSAAPSSAPTTDPRTDSKPGATEIVTARTEYSQTFDNHDGTKTSQFFMDQAFYRPTGSADLVPVAVGFVPSTTSGVDAISDQAPVAVSLADSKAPGAFLALRSGGQTVGFRLPADLATGAANVKPTIAGPVADYPGLLPGVDLRVIANAHGAKSFFIWRAPPADPVLRYVVDAPGLTLTPRADGSIALVDAAGTTIAAIPHPYAVDSTPDVFAGGGRYTDAVSLSLGRDGRTVTVAVDPGWLKSAVYPVYVDPSTGWVYNAGSNSYGDAHTASAFPDLNFDDYQRPDSPYYHELWNGTDPSGTSGNSYDFLKWNLSAYLGSTVDSATLALVPYYQYYNSPTTETTYVRRVTETWTENGITWNSMPNYTTTNTATAGCVEGSWCTWDVAAIVQMWLRSGSPATNFGFQVDTIGKGSTYWKRFIASEQGGSNRPKLTITYHTPTATVVAPTGATSSQVVSWTYADSGADPQTKFHVDVASDENFTSIVSTSGDVSSAATSWTIPATLTEGTTYHWRVKVFDGVSWSAWAASPFSLDATAPSVTVFTPPATPTNATSLPYSLTFDESVTGLAAGDFTIGGTATGWSVSSVGGSGAGPYTVTLTGGTEGTVVLTLAADAVNDGSSTPGPTSPSVAATVTVDRSAPSVSAFTPPTTPTAATSLAYALTFSEPVSGLTAGDLGISGSATGWSVASITGSGPYTVTLTGGTAGTVILTLTSGAVSDSAGNTGPTSPSVAATVTVDRTAPSVSAFDAPASPTNATSLAYTLTFGEPVAGLGAGDATITGSATGWSVSSITGSGPYTVTLIGGGPGTVILTLTANTVADLAGNQGPTSARTATTVTVDRTAPGLSAFDAPSSPTAATTLPYSITFDEPVTGLAASDFTFPGTATGWSIGSLTGSGAGPYSLSLTGGTAGTVILTLGANAVVDTAGTPGPASPATAATVTVDRTAPVAPSTPDLDAASDTGTSSTDDITKATTGLVFTGTAEPNTTVRLLDGAAQVGTGLADGSGAWTITVAGPLVDGGHSVGATATDAAGNTSAASWSLAVLVVTTVGPAEIEMPDEAAALDVITSSLAIAWATPNGPAGIASQSIQARIATPIDDACVGVTWSAWSDAVAATSPTDADLSAGQCHQWQVVLVDGAGNTSAAVSGTVLAHPATLQLGTADPTVQLDPQPALNVVPPAAVLHLGDQVDLTTELRYEEAVLDLGSDLTALNPSDGTATIEALTVTLEKRAPGQGPWTAIAAHSVGRPGWTPISSPPTGLMDIAIAAPGAAATGVTYPPVFEPVIGTVLEPGANAQWAARFGIRLDAATIQALQDAQTVAGIRLVVHLEVSYAGADPGQPEDAAIDVTGAVQALGTAITDGHITIVSGEASPVTFDEGTIPALAQVELGAAPVGAQVSLTVPGTTAKAQGESDDAYLARLRTYGELSVAATAGATSATSQSITVERSGTLKVSLPILFVTTPPTATQTVGGSSASVSMTITNVGNASTSSVSVETNLDPAVAGDVSGIVAQLAPPASTDLSVSYSVPSAHAEGTALSTISVSWTDDANHVFGPIVVSSDVWVTNGAAGAPSVSLPWTPRVLFGTEPIAADASDDVGVVSVDLVVDGSVVSSTSVEPFAFEWDTTTSVDGDHVIQVRAHDGGGNVTTTAPLAIAIDNALPSVDRVRTDRDSARLTPDEAALDGVQAVVDATQLPARYQSSTPSSTDGTSDLLEAAADINNLSPDTQDGIASIINSARPTGGSVDFDALPAGFQQYCSRSGPCDIGTLHFHLRYWLDGPYALIHTFPQNQLSYEDLYKVVDETGAFNIQGQASQMRLQLCVGVDPAIGVCDGIPDVVDRAALGFEQARQTYAEMSYEMPPEVTYVYFTDSQGRCLGSTLDAIVIGRDECESIAYLAAHEFFHSVQLHGFAANGPVAILSAIARTFGTWKLDVVERGHRRVGGTPDEARIPEQRGGRWWRIPWKHLRAPKPPTGTIVLKCWRTRIWRGPPRGVPRGARLQPARLDRRWGHRSGSDHHQAHLGPDLEGIKRRASNRGGLVLARCDQRTGAV